jgi:HlyD family secretion protein
MSAERFGDTKNAGSNDLLRKRFTMKSPKRHLLVAPLGFGGVGLAAIAMSLQLGCGSSKDAAEPAPTVTVQAASVQSKTIHATVTTHAVLYPRDQVTIVPKVVAPIKKFYVQRGSRVRAGELLAELENRDLQGALTENQGGYQQAEATYKSASQSAEQDLKVAKQQLDAAQKVFDARQTLYKQGAMAEKDVEDARIALTQAQNNYDLAQKQYNLKVAEGQLIAAKGKTASAQAQLSYTRITSPISGVVTDRPYFVGDTAPSGAPILTIMDLSKVVARAYIAPQQAAELHEGDAAKVTGADGNEEISGRVTVVSPAVDPNSTAMQVWVEVPNPGDRLKPGTTVGLSIVANTVKSALVVPADAVLTAPDGKATVMVIGKDQLAHQTEVTTGIHEDGEVQILSGLEAGEQIVTTGAYGLPDGAKVAIAKPAAQPAEPD